MTQALPAVTRLALRDFRSHADHTIEVDPGPVVLTGPNGAGKTNLLEALSLLVPGRGLRRATATHMAKLGGRGGWRIAAALRIASGPLEIATEQATGGGERRSVEVDGATRKGQAVLATFHSQLWLTPAMDRLFAEAPAGRRRFLDRVVYGFDPEHAGRVARFEQALRERGRLLRDGPADPAWLSALEDQMARHGVAVAAARVETTAALNDALAAAPGPFPRAGLSLDGQLEAALPGRPALAVEDWYRHELARARLPDGGETATPGPHRGDLSVVHTATGMPAALCSTGEQKALLLSIQLAAARLIAATKGQPPILLLDEVAAHLDPARRAALFDQVLRLGGQAWFTGTETAPFGDLAGRAGFIALEMPSGGIVRSPPHPSVE